MGASAGGIIIPFNGTYEDACKLIEKLKVFL